MSDLTLDQLKKAYDAALEQIAAESDLFQGMMGIKGSGVFDDDTNTLLLCVLGSDRSITDIGP